MLYAISILLHENVQENLILLVFMIPFFVAYGTKVTACNGKKVLG